MKVMRENVKGSSRMHEVFNAVFKTLFIKCVHFDQKHTLMAK